MLEGANERLRVEGVLGGSRTRLPRGRYGGVREVFYEVLDYEIFTLCQ